MVVSTTAMKEARHNKKSARRLRDTMPDLGRCSLLLSSGVHGVDRTC
jgi:hypothetical protein